MKTLVQYRSGIPPELAEECRFFQKTGPGKEDLPKGWNDPKNWKVLDDIPEEAQFGFAIGGHADACSTYFLVDFDHALDPATGDFVSPWIQSIYRRIVSAGKTYVERSVSGTGMHMIGNLGDYAESFSSVSNSTMEIIVDMDPREYTKLSKEEREFIPKVEFFFHNKSRYVILTGDHTGDPIPIACDEVAAGIFSEILKIRAETHARYGIKESGDPSRNFCEEAPDLNDTESLLPPVDKETFKRVMSALPHISAADYTTWIRVGLALRNAHFPFSVWDEWSQWSDKINKVPYPDYSRDETRKKWRSFARTPSQWNVGSIFLWAKESGWKDSLTQKRSAVPEIPISGEVSRSAIISSIRCLSEITEEEIRWVLFPYIPREEITLVAGPGGVGKGLVIASILEGLTNGRAPSLLPHCEPFESEPESILYLTTEDSSQKVLLPRLRKAGADLDRIHFIDKDDPIIHQIEFSDRNRILETVLEELRPTLVIMDPLQSFIPDRTRMAERNQMRRCLNHLSVLSDNYETAFIILAHTNKRGALDPRQALADSADIWDITRSALFVGRTDKDGLLYFSQEKCNYARPSDTVLFSINAGKAVHEGITAKHFSDFAASANKREYTAPKREAAEEMITQILQKAPNRTMRAKDFNDLCEASGIKEGTLKRTKAEMKEQGKIRYYHTGNEKDDIVWYIKLTAR